MTRTRRQRRGPTTAAVSRVGDLSVVIGAAALAVSLVCLSRIGPPPPVHVDTLWVAGHERGIHLCLLSLGAAAAVSVFSVIVSKRRWVVAVLWALAGAVTAAFFSDRIPLIIEVIIRHRL